MIATNAPLVLEQMAADRQRHRQAAARSYRLSRLARGRSAGGAPAEGRPARTAVTPAGKVRLERYASLL
jgi:hypothetical protein